MTTGEGVALGFGALVLLGGGYMVLANMQQSQTQALALQLSQTQAQLAAGKHDASPVQSPPKQGGALGVVSGLLNSGVASALLQFAQEQLN
jgi:hypothetical protein